MAKVLAVALNTVKQALRMKIALVFIILLLVLLPVLAFGSTGDGTLKGRLQTVISYGMSLTGLLLALLTIFVTTHTATSDVVQRQVFTVLTKPIRRWQFMLGKFLGVLFLDLALLALFSVTIYSFVVFLPLIEHASPEEIASLQRSFYTSRASLKPPEATIDEEAVQEEYEEMERSGKLAPFTEKGIGPDVIKARLRNIKKLEKTAAEVGRDLVWTFENVRVTDPNDLLFIRFKYDVAVNPPDLQVYSVWAVGDNRSLRTPEALPTQMIPVERKDPIRTLREFSVPASIVAEDGYLAVAFLNIPLNSTTIIFPIEDGLEVMYKAGTFRGNFLRAVLLLLFRLVFLAAVSIFASSFLSFPVAILLCLMIFMTATVSGFVTDSFGYLNKDIGQVYDVTLKLVLDVLPKFDKYNPTTFLIAGRQISTWMLIKAGTQMAVLWAAICLGLGLWIFSSREVARTH